MFIKLQPPIRESVTGFNKLFEEFISIIPALFNGKQFNRITFFLRGKTMMFKEEPLQRGHE